MRCEVLGDPCDTAMGGEWAAGDSGGGDTMDHLSRYTVAHHTPMWGVLYRGPVAQIAYRVLQIPTGIVLVNQAFDVWTVRPFDG